MQIKSAFLCWQNHSQGLRKCYVRLPVSRCLRPTIVPSWDGGVLIQSVLQRISRGKELPSPRRRFIHSCDLSMGQDFQRGVGKLSDQLMLIRNVSVQLPQVSDAM